MSETLASVIVGIDGSDAAINAALWAADEAVSRGLPLRLIYVTKSHHPSADDYYQDIHRAEASLRAAQAAVVATGKQVKIETDMLTGPPGAALVAESREAELICVGSVRIGRYARSILGSTATELAEKAHCRVAIIRLQTDERNHDIHWIVIKMDDSTQNADVIADAMFEAKLRHAPVLALGDRRDRTELERKVEKWARRYPDVHIYPIADDPDVAGFVRHHDEPVQLVVIGASQVGELAEILGNYGLPLFRHGHSSVLVSRRTDEG